MIDHLIQLAPDAKTLEAGRRLFYSRRWRLLGGDGEWIWGEFDVGGKRPVESAVQVVRGRFSCSCRSRSRPCAHNLALVLLLKNNPDRLTVGQPPEWVRSVQYQAERAPKPVKDAAQAEDRLAARLELMTAGIDELELRLLDVARRGIADTLGQGSESWLAMATRLTDAKLPGPAGRVRRLASLGAEGTEGEIARTLGDLYLFIRSWRIREELPEERRAELYQFAGITTRKEELLAQPARDDHWLVLGTVSGTEDRLRYRRVWLRGEQSRRYALLLDYAFGEFPFEQSWPLSASFSGGVRYYPGSYPQRAVFTDPRPGGRPYDGLKGYPSFEEMLGNYRRALGTNPWLYYYPVYLESVRPVKSGEDMLLVDVRGSALPVMLGYEGFYRLLAVSGGGPLSLFAEFDGYRLRPLSVLTALGLTEA
ncbi:hypothetical protein GGR26_000345 [Lewinella marina]|uniref:SWIM-type domain-containing protein n=1 Tax=Neolewinella marina TaxID=438751 RepID=A0A2G0CJR7_9BACT|nr:hypothetical protein [Neolewinella marina]NJB84600.1 hypothetical protein [Neolewinella marina]PHL00223.1 hypothetical protein CGL56_04065 [Neolewinella marina]